MHEFPEVQAMVRQACAQVPPGARLRSISIVVGEASGHDERHIEAHFDEASRGTAAEGAVLSFTREKLAARCSACNTEFSPTGLLLACTKCGGTELTIIAGDSVRLASVESA
jgi:hydrogenase nickel incorporation protein HypA/HybF